MAPLNVWIQAARPKTLSASWIPILVGSFLFFKESRTLNYFIFSCAMLCSLFIQVATNYLNDAIDFKKGADTAERIGPTRMTQAGQAGYQQMMRAGIVCLFIAALFGCPLILAGGWGFLVLGALSLGLAFMYTGGPFPLAYLGLGDIFVYLFFGLLAVGGSYFLQSGKVSNSSLVLASQIGLLATVLIAINNFRDMNQDKTVNKKTLAVRFGPCFMRVEIGFCLFVPYLLNAFWLKQFGLTMFLLPFLTLPLAIRIFISVLKTEPSSAYNKFLGQSGLLHMLFGLLIFIGMVFG